MSLKIGFSAPYEPRGAFMEDLYMASDNQFVKIGSVLVDPEILTRPYVCDVQKYGCRSMCCYRSCIVPEQEARRVEAHIDGILLYLSRENREAIRKNGGILAVCAKQCPAGCVIQEDEARAIRRNFGGSDFRCVLMFNNDCVLIYTNDKGLRYCSVHSYAIERGLVLEEFKFTDCVQYPLSIYMNNGGEKVLSIQNTPYLKHIPCMNTPSGELMYKSLRKTIETMLGLDFYRQLEEFAASR